MTRSLCGPTATARILFISPMVCSSCPLLPLSNDTIRLPQHFVGYRDANACCGLHIDDHHWIDRLDREFARPSPFGDLVDVAGYPRARLVGAGPVAADGSPVGHEILQPEGGNALLDAGAQDQIQIADDQRIRENHDAVRGLPADLRQRGLQLGAIADGPINDLDVHASGGGLDFRQALLRRRIIRPAQRDEAVQAGEHLLEQFHALAAALHLLVAHSRDEAARTRQRPDKAVSHRVADAGKKNRNWMLARFLLRDPDSRRGDGHDDVHRFLGEFPGKAGQLLPGAHPNVDPEAAAGQARGVGAILDVFELVELIEQPQDIEGDGFTLRFGGGLTRSVGRTAPYRNVARAEREDADLEWFHLCRRGRSASYQQEGDRQAGETARRAAGAAKAGRRSERNVATLMRLRLPRGCGGFAGRSGNRSPASEILPVERWHGDLSGWPINVSRGQRERVRGMSARRQVKWLTSGHETPV